MAISEEDRMRLADIAGSITEIQGYTGSADFKDFNIREDMRMAINSHLQQIGGAAALLSDEFKENFRDVDWDVLRGLQYANFDQELELDSHPQWYIVENDLPKILETITDITTQIEAKEALEDDLHFVNGNQPVEDMEQQEEDDFFNLRLSDPLEEGSEDEGPRIKKVEDDLFIESVPDNDFQIIEEADNSFIDQRFEDVDLMEGSSLDDEPEDEKESEEQNLNKK